MAPQTDDADFPWHLGVFDAHCHPTDTLSSLQEIPRMCANVLTVMATRSQDQELVARAADKFGLSQQDAQNVDTDWSKQHRVIPAFGWHPWFSYQMFDESMYNGAEKLLPQDKAKHYAAVLIGPENQDFMQSLPDPRPFGSFLNEMRHYLEQYPLALVGEVGLDRAFKIPEAWLPEQAESRDDTLTPGGREGRRLSPYRVNLEHQQQLLLAQLRLAAEMQRAVSLHGVQAHGVLYSTVAQTWKGFEKPVMSRRERKKATSAALLDADPVESDDDSNDSTAPKPYPPRLCLHSFSGSPEQVKQYTAPSVPCDIFFSFSIGINAWSESGDGKVEATIEVVPDDRILIESDLHTAGAAMDQNLEEVVRKVCEVKKWTLEQGLERLGQNWRRFVFGLA